MFVLPLGGAIFMARATSVGLPASALAGADRRALVALWADAEAVMAQMATSVRGRWYRVGG